MKPEKDDGAICADPPDEKDDSNSGGEVDLYSELISFSQLSPTGQLKTIAAMEQASAEAKKKAEETLAESVDSSSPSASVDTATTEKSSVASPVEELVEHASNISVELPGKPESDQSSASSGKLTAETKASEEPATESPASTPVVKESPSTIESSRQPAEINSTAGGPRPSGPLSGFNLPTNIVYTGTIAAGACISCGAETGADDLFCVACGGFVDDIDTVVIIPKCTECKREVSTEEVFCPWCGAASVG